jgi:hypothetical protein
LEELVIEVRLLGRVDAHEIATALILRECLVDDLSVL